MNKDIADLAMMFLMRTSLNGSETPQFLAVMSALEAISLDSQGQEGYGEPCQKVESSQFS